MTFTYAAGTVWTYGSDGLFNGFAAGTAEYPALTTYPGLGAYPGLRSTGRTPTYGGTGGFTYASTASATYN